MPPAAPSSELRALADLAYEAGLEIERVRRAGFAAQTKADGSPVTIADRAAEAIIREGLARLSPGVPIVGEEGVADGDRPVCKECFFLVDPLDGTRDFVDGETGEFSVNIGYVEAGRPVRGAVYAPASGRLYCGGPEGAFAAQCAPAARAPYRLAPIAAAADPTREARLRILVSRASRRGPELDAFLARLPPHELRPMSSSLKLCALAAGDADLYPRFGPVSEWDLAAGHAVLRAAGGDVETLEGAPLRYAGVGDYETPRFLAYASPAAAEIARRALKR